MRKFFDSIVKPVDRGSTDSLYILFCVAAISSGVVFAVAVGATLIGVQAGQFGDFIGGTLNPILTFLTFMGLIVTIVLQQHELADTRKELARSAEALEKQSAALHRQNFENTFFQMLSLHNQLVGAMDVRANAGTLHGRDCFKHFYSEMKGIYGRQDCEDEQEKIRRVNALVWDNHHQDLAHYLRYLVNIFELIGSSSVEKEKYIAIVCSQLSSFEMVIIFYNGLTPHATHLKAHIERYSVFENAPLHLLFSPSHRYYFEATAFEKMKVEVSYGNISR